LVWVLASDEDTGVRVITGGAGSAILLLNFWDTEAVTNLYAWILEPR